jgi:Na+/melibiose symporter-like transporter
VVAGYAISTAVLLVTGGRLGDQFGRRRVFAIGMGFFVATSAACALAPDPAVLVAARLVQGVGAALMAPNILSILGVVYTGPARVRAISVYGMVMGLAATSGQLIGGVLIRWDIAGLGWRTIFWINVPLGVPLLRPQVFSAWPLRAGLLTQLVFWCQQAAGYLVLGLYLQQGRGLSPLSSGAVFTVLAVGYLATSFRAPALTVRFGRPVIAVGAVIAAAGDAALYLAAAHTGTGGSVAWLFPGLIILGAGQGCASPP